MSLLLRKLLSRFLTLGVGEGDDQTLPDDTPTDEPSVPDEEPALEDLMGADEAPEPKDDPKERLTAAERRAADLERELAAERAARQAPPHVPSRDPDYEREEAELAKVRESGDQNALEWAQWRINQNRVIRDSQRTSQNALAEARDIADRTEFGKLELTKPKLYKAYADRVEKVVSEARSKGQGSAPRLMILKYLVGEDMMNNKVKAKPARSAALEGQPQRVERQRLPAARSDVSGRASQSEREKRRARLENQPI